MERAHAHKLSMLFCSVLGSVLPLQEEAQRQVLQLPLFCAVLSIPLYVALQCDLSNDVLVFQLILSPLAATLCF